MCTHLGIRNLPETVISSRALLVAIANGIYQQLFHLTAMPAHKTLPYIFITPSKGPLLRRGSGSAGRVDIWAIYTETGEVGEPGRSFSESTSTRLSGSFTATLIPLFIAITIDYTYNASHSSPHTFTRLIMFGAKRYCNGS